MVSSLSGSGVIERDIMLCEVIAGLGNIRGRKRFQKSMFIAKALGYPVPEDFVWGNYGVYSSQLQWELDSLVRDEMIVERNAAKPGQPAEYDYSVDAGGAQLLERAKMLAAEVGEAGSSLNQADDPVSCIGNNEIVALIAFLRKMSEKSVRDLELWSSILYLRQSEKNDENLISFLRYLKPQYSVEDVQKGIGEVEGLSALSFQKVRSLKASGKTSK